MTLAAAIKELRLRVGSHDKLAAQLGTTRNSVIQWEKGRYPRDFVDQLREAGVPAELLTPPKRPARESPRAHQEALEASVLELTRDVRRLTRRVAALERQAHTGSGGAEKARR